MLKRIVILAFLLSAVVLLAMAPMNTDGTHRLQATEAPTTEGGGVTIGVTVVAGTQEATPVIPVTGGGGMPMSSLLIFGLVAVLGVAVVIGGMALLSRRQ